MKKFPAYKNMQAAAAAGCWKCEGKMMESTAKDTGYPPKRGQYSMQCGSCRLFKFFDLKQ